MANTLLNPITYFNDPTTNRPVALGSIFIGIPGLDPFIESNRVTVNVKEEDGTLVPIPPESQPLSTSAGGNVEFNGSPVQVIIDGDFSIKVLNNLDGQVYFQSSVQTPIEATDVDYTTTSCGIITATNVQDALTELCDASDVNATNISTNVTDISTNTTNITTNADNVTTLFDAQRTIQIVHLFDPESTGGVTIIPVDDTIPQNTEGDEYLSLAITPEDISNELFIEVITNSATNSGGAKITMALFQDSIVNALAAVMMKPDSNNEPIQLVLRHKIIAGTTSLTTFKIRIGVSTASTLTFNGLNGTRRFGDVMSSTITITEVTP
jgi:hypothetical protein